MSEDEVARLASWLRDGQSDRAALSGVPEGAASDYEAAWSDLWDQVSNNPRYSGIDLRRRIEAALSGISEGAASHTARLRDAAQAAYDLLEQSGGAHDATVHARRILRAALVTTEDKR